MHAWCSTGSSPARRDDTTADVASQARSRWQRVVPWASAGVLALGLMLIAAPHRPATRRRRPRARGRAGDVHDRAAGEHGVWRSQVAGLWQRHASGCLAGWPENRVRCRRQCRLPDLAARVGTLAVRPIPGTESGVFPLWSPDSRFIGFFAAGKLKKVQVSGGPPIVLCDAPFARGGSWSRDDVILFTPSTNGPLYRVSSAGGVPPVATTLDPTTGKRAIGGRPFCQTAVIFSTRPRWDPAVLRRSRGDQNRIARPGRGGCHAVRGAESSVSTPRAICCSSRRTSC